MTVNRQGLARQAVRELNEAYYSESPADHFKTRFWSLVQLLDEGTSVDLAKASDPDTNIGRIAAMLPGWEFVSKTRGHEPSLEKSITIEALALMHHVGETLIRQFAAVRSCTADESPWFEMANDKSPDDFRKFCSGLISNPDEQGIQDVFFPQNALGSDKKGSPTTEEIQQTVTEWLQHFASLVVPEGFDSASAHNQIKHGLAVVAVDDLRVDLVPNIVDVAAPTIGELNAGVPLIDTSSVRYLHRWRPDRGHEWAWELRLEHADPLLSLAIAHMGINMLNLLWSVSRPKFAPWIVAGGLQRVEYWRSPRPSEVLRHSRSNPIRISRPLIEPAPIHKDANRRPGS